MSRSRKRSRFIDIAASGNGRVFRRCANKAMRAKARAAIKQCHFDDLPVRLEEVSEIYDYKDYSRYVSTDDSEWSLKVWEQQKRK